MDVKPAGIGTLLAKAVSGVFGVVTGSSVGEHAKEGPPEHPKKPTQNVVSNQGGRLDVVHVEAQQTDAKDRPTLDTLG